jgi:hypothetical protein
MYTRPVKFETTDNYGCGPDDDVYTVEAFKDNVFCGLFIDYDGHGYPVKDKHADTSIVIYPSELYNIPEDATHIVWYNR